MLPSPSVASARRDEASVLDAAPTSAARSPSEGDSIHATREAARSALESEDFSQARRLYEGAVAENPDDGAILREWADVQQYRLDDLPGALATWRRYLEATPSPAPDERFRLAQLLVWTGNHVEAPRQLTAVLEVRPDHAEGWALLGEVYRWESDRPRAAAAYARALALEPDNGVAFAGRGLLDGDTERAIAAVDGRSWIPVAAFSRDSDGFRRAELRTTGSTLAGGRVLEASAGIRRIEGHALEGNGVAEGGFAELSLARWAREGTIRLSASVGADHSDRSGTEPILAARAQGFDLHGWNLSTEVRRAPAHELLSTFESLEAGTRADRLVIDAYRGLVGGLELSAFGEATHLRTGNVTLGRVAAGVAVSRVLGGWVRTGVTARAIGYGGSASIDAGRRLFWDPHSYFNAGLLLELRTSQASGAVSGHIRAVPGVARAHERGTEGPIHLGTFESEAGVRVRADTFDLVLDGFFARGRAGEYTAQGFTLGVEIAR